MDTTSGNCYIDTGGSQSGSGYTIISKTRKIMKRFITLLVIGTIIMIFLASIRNTGGNSKHRVVKQPTLTKEERAIVTRNALDNVENTLKNEPVARIPID